MTPSGRATCASCKWWERDVESDSAGRCHRDPKPEWTGQFYYCASHQPEHASAAALAGAQWCDSLCLQPRGHDGEHSSAWQKARADYLAKHYPDPAEPRAAGHGEAYQPGLGVLGYVNPGVEPCKRCQHANCPGAPRHKGVCDANEAYFDAHPEIPRPQEYCVQRAGGGDYMEHRDDTLGYVKGTSEERLRTNQWGGVRVEMEPLPEAPAEGGARYVVDWVYGRYAVKRDGFVYIHCDVDSSLDENRRRAVAIAVALNARGVQRSDALDLVRRLVAWAESGPNAVETLNDILTDARALAQEAT